MKLFVCKEIAPQETRVPLLPIDVGKLIKLGADVEVEPGMGESIMVPDIAYDKVGARICSDRQAALAQADMLLRMSIPPKADIQSLPKGCIHVSFLDPFSKRIVC